MQGQICPFVPILTPSSGLHKTWVKSLSIFKKREQNHQVEKTRENHHFSSKQGKITILAKSPKVEKQTNRV
jgi:hypothetical protein